MTSHLKCGDLRYDKDGNEVQLIHYYRNDVPRQSLWSVVNSMGEIEIVDLGPAGPKYRKAPKRDGGTRVKKFSTAEWAALEQQSVAMGQSAPSSYGVTAVEDAADVDAASDGSAADLRDVGTSGGLLWVLTSTIFLSF